MLISIHAPVWGATFMVDDGIDIVEFQSTHPYGVRPTCTYQKLVSISFQSTHPYGVRRGVTAGGRLCQKFQSTHPYGVRRLSKLYRTWSWKFQSTHPYGVRQYLFYKVSDLLNISIHAPVWGAT